jgi:predicted transcriptional regulator
MSENKITRPRIDDNAFVSAWMDAHKNGGNQGDVAKKLGCTAGGVSTKAKKLVDRGVKLPKLGGRHEVNVDVNGLNDLIATFD